MTASRRTRRPLITTAIDASKVEIGTEVIAPANTDPRVEIGHPTTASETEARAARSAKYLAQAEEEYRRLYCELPSGTFSALVQLFRERN